MNQKKILVLTLSCIFLFFFLYIPGAISAEKKKIAIQAGVVGGTTYQMGYAMSVIVNKYSKTMELYPVETVSNTVCIDKVIESPTSNLGVTALTGFRQAVKGLRPFDKPDPNLRVFANLTRNCLTFITLDPKIKTMPDFKKKRIGFGPAPAVTGRTAKDFVEIGYDMKGKFRALYMRWPRLKDAILDGSIDAMVLGISTRSTPPWAPVPIFQEIVTARKKVYFIPMSIEAVNKTSKAHKIHYAPSTVPKDSVAPGMPAKDIPCWADDLSVIGHKDFDPALAYEIAKILDEHALEMKETTGVAKGTTPELVRAFLVPENLVHSGIVKFHKEKGHM